MNQPNFFNSQSGSEYRNHRETHQKASGLELTDFDTKESNERCGIIRLCQKCGVDSSQCQALFAAEKDEGKIVELNGICQQIFEYMSLFDNPQGFLEYIQSFLVFRGQDLPGGGDVFFNQVSDICASFEHIESTRRVIRTMQHFDFDKLYTFWKKTELTLEEFRNNFPELLNTFRRNPNWNSRFTRLLEMDRKKISKFKNFLEMGVIDDRLWIPTSDRELFSDLELLRGWLKVSEYAYKNGAGVLDEYFADTYKILNQFELTNQEFKERIIKPCFALLSEDQKAQVRDSMVFDLRRHPHPDVQKVFGANGLNGVNIDLWLHYFGAFLSHGITKPGSIPLIKADLAYCWSDLSRFANAYSFFRTPGMYESIRKILHEFDSPMQFKAVFLPIFSINLDQMADQEFSSFLAISPEFFEFCQKYEIVKKSILTYSSVISKVNTESPAFALLEFSLDPSASMPELIPEILQRYSHDDAQLRLNLEKMVRVIMSNSQIISAYAEKVGIMYHLVDQFDDCLKDPGGILSLDSNPFRKNTLIKGLVMPEFYKLALLLYVVYYHQNYTQNPAYNILYGLLQNQTKQFIAEHEVSLTPEEVLEYKKKKPATLKNEIPATKKIHSSHYRLIGKYRALEDQAMTLYMLVLPEPKASQGSTEESTPIDQKPNENLAPLPLILEFMEHPVFNRLVQEYEQDLKEYNHES